MKDNHSLELIAQEIKETALQLFSSSLKNVILYGSYARGNYNDESDIDIMILADIPKEDCWKERMKISKITGWLDMEYNVLISLHDRKVKSQQ